MAFKIDPKTFLAKRETPLGIHLRRDLLQDAGKGDKALVERLRKDITGRQLGDGSWGHSLVETSRAIDSLVDLGLKEDKAVEKGALWILARQNAPQAYREDFFALTEKDRASPGRVFTGEAIVSRVSARFMHSNYALRCLIRAGFGSEPQVRKNIKRLEALIGDAQVYCCGRCSQSVLQAFGVHPHLRNHDIVQRGIRWLAKRQKTNGEWCSLPFYHSLHSLSYNDGKEAVRQMVRLLPRLERTQNKDGSWGKCFVDERTAVVARVLATLGEL